MKKKGLLFFGIFFLMLLSINARNSLYNNIDCNNDNIYIEVKSHKGKIGTKEKGKAPKDNGKAPTNNKVTWRNPFILRNIKFGYTSSALFESSFPELRKLANKMKVNPDLMLKIIGYSDNTGSSIFNLNLSTRRAKAIKAFLVQHGVSAERIIAVGKGEANPVADNKTPTGRAQNRRIEVQFKEVK